MFVVQFAVLNFSREFIYAMLTVSPRTEDLLSSISVLIECDRCNMPIVHDLEKKT